LQIITRWMTQSSIKLPQQSMLYLGINRDICSNLFDRT